MLNFNFHHVSRCIMTEPEVMDIAEASARLMRITPLSVEVCIEERLTSGTWQVSVFVSGPENPAMLSWDEAQYDEMCIPSSGLCIYTELSFSLACL